MPPIAELFPGLHPPRGGYPLPTAAGSPSFAVDRGSGLSPQEFSKVEH